MIALVDSQVAAADGLVPAQKREQQRVVSSPPCYYVDALFDEVHLSSDLDPRPSWEDITKVILIWQLPMGR